MVRARRPSARHPAAANRGRADSGCPDSAPVRRPPPHPTPQARRSARCAFLSPGLNYTGSGQPIARRRVSRRFFRVRFVVPPLTAKLLLSHTPKPNYRLRSDACRVLAADFDLLIEGRDRPAPETGRSIRIRGLLVRPAARRVSSPMRRVGVDGPRDSGDRRRVTCPKSVLQSPGPPGKRGTV